MAQTLTAFSESISQLVASAAPMLTTIRVGSSRHVTGLVCQRDLILTIDRALPALPSYTVVLSNRSVVTARPGSRDPVCNLAVLRLDSPWPVPDPGTATTSVGSLVFVLGTEDDASPTVRLAVVHRFTHTADGPAPVLDLPGASLDQGSPVLDGEGRLVGLAALGPAGEALAIPSSVLGRMQRRDDGTAEPASTDISPVPFHRRGWLGVALQPVTLPVQFLDRAGQPAGRMVISITKDSPAEVAGIRVGDVLLALGGLSASGPSALRVFLDGDRVGTTAEVKLLRDGNVVTSQLMFTARAS